MNCQRTRKCADQHKCLPQTRMHKPNATIILFFLVNSKNDFEIREKTFH